MKKLFLLTSLFLATGLIGFNVALGLDVWPAKEWLIVDQPLQVLGGRTAEPGLTQATADTLYAPLAGAGTVTSVSVTTANGVSGTVANSTTTPAISLTLGAITPTTVNGLRVDKGNNSINYNTAIGESALAGSNSGVGRNLAIGYGALLANTSGFRNVAVGYNAMDANSTGDYSVAVGADSLGSLSSGDYNTAIGVSSLLNNNGASSVAVGYSAGYYETGSNKLYIDNQGRGSESAARSSAMLYGQFSSATSTQYLTVNGKLGINTQTPSDDLDVAGTSIFRGILNLVTDLVLGENASIAQDPSLSADGKYTGITRTGTAGTALAFGDLVYLDPTDSRWELADANSAINTDGDARAIIGICVLAAAGDGSATKILLSGTVRADAAFPTMTINAPLYVSETAGDITGTAPVTTDSVMRVLGWGLTADELLFQPSSDYLTHI